MARWSHLEYCTVVFAVRNISLLSVEKKYRFYLKRIKERRIGTLGTYTMAERAAIVASLRYFYDIYSISLENPDKKDHSWQVIQANLEALRRTIEKTEGSIKQNSKGKR